MRRGYSSPIRYWMNRLRRLLRAIQIEKSTTYRGVERRQFRRVRCHNLVRCEYVNADRCHWVGNLKNLSEGGVKMLCPSPLEQDDILKLIINFTRWEVNLVMAARLVWIAPLGNREGYEAGLSFLDGEPVYYQSIIREYLQSRLRRRLS